MVRPKGVEPLTARFVAEYSIQLSYECVISSESAHYSAEPLMSQACGVKKCNQC